MDGSKLPSFSVFHIVEYVISQDKPKLETLKGDAKMKMTTLQEITRKLETLLRPHVVVPQALPINKDMPEHEKNFYEAVNHLSSEVSPDCDVATLSKLYALFKQATGDAVHPRDEPSYTGDLIVLAVFRARLHVRELSKISAMEAFVELAGKVQKQPSTSSNWHSFDIADYGETSPMSPGLAQLVLGRDTAIDPTLQMTVPVHDRMAIDGGTIDQSQSSGDPQSLGVREHGLDVSQSSSTLSRQAKRTGDGGVESEKPVAKRMFLEESPNFLPNSHEEDLASIHNIWKTLESGVYKITINRPEKLNGFTVEMFRRLSSLLQDSSNNRDVVVTVITGTGTYFSSGIDLDCFAKGTSGEDMAEAVENYIKSVINHNKPLIGIINGHCSEVAAAMLPLFDYVLMDDESTVHTDFIERGGSPLGCSSLTFPLLMGHSKATEALIIGKRMSAKEAMSVGIVTQTANSRDIVSASENIIARFSQLPRAAASASKQLLRKNYRQLLQANIEECLVIQEQWKMDNFKRIITNITQGEKK